MTLLIALLIINGLNMSAWLVPLAIVVWVLHLLYADA